MKTTLSASLLALLQPGRGLRMRMMAILLLVLGTGAATAQISGLHNVCQGNTITLTDPGVSGSWTSASPGVATVGSGTGVVTGISTGTALISYTFGATTDTMTVTVNPNPAPITGPTILLGGPLYIPALSSPTMSDATPGGTWSCSNTAIATIGAVTGVMTAVTCGIATVYYTLPTGCRASHTDTVICGPATAWYYSSITGGSAPLCVGGTVTLADTPAGGTWMSSNTAVATVGSSTGVVTGISTGTCTIVYMAGTVYAATTLTVNPNPAAITGPTSICGGSSFTLTDATPGGTWSSSNTAIATIGSTGVMNGVGGGTVNISYTLPSGCMAVKTMSVYALTIAFGVTGGGTMCAGGTGLHVGIPGSIIGYNYQLFRDGIPVGFPIPGTGLPLDFGPQTIAGVYTITATNTVTGCYLYMTGSATIVVNPVPAAITGPAALCAGSTLTLSSTPGGGVWSTSNGAIATVIPASGIVTGVTTGTATITYTLPTGCIATKDVTVSTSPCALSTSMSVCIGSPATLTNCIAGGVWTSSNGAVATIGSLSGTVAPVTTGTTTITYSLGTGCIVSNTLTVVAAPAPIAGATTTCVGATLTLTDATAGGTWSSSATSVATITSGGVATGVTAGTSTISYSIGSCAATSIITVNTTPGAIGGPASVCMGDSILATNGVSGGVWHISPSTHATIDTVTGMVHGVGPGTATVSYTLGSCTASRIITVNAVTPITGTTGVCVGSTTSLSNIIAGGNWTSNNTAVATVVTGTGVVTGVAPGTAVISYTLPAGCLVTTTVTVGASPGPISGPYTVCNGACITLAAGMSGGTWSSSFGAIATVDATTGMVCGLAPGAVTISYTRSGCAATTSISVNPSPAAVSGPGSVCEGGTATYTDVFAGGTWSSGSTAVATINASTGTLSAVSSGTAIISYTFGSGCTAILPVVVNPFTTTAGPTSVCVAQTINLTNSTPGGSWTSSATSVATVNTAGVVTGIAAGTTTIDYTLPGGCVAAVVVTVNALPAPIAGPGAVCAGSSINLTDPTPGAVWASTSPAVASVTSTGTVTGLTAGTTTISYTYPGGCGTAYGVTVNPLPAAITGPTSVCIGGSVVLADVSYGGTWTSSVPAVAAIGSSSGVVTALVTGTTTATYTLTTGCAATYGLSVIAMPAAIGGSLAVCTGATTTLSNTTPGGTWSSSNTLLAPINALTGEVAGVTPGTAVITYATGTAGCSVTAIVTVNVMPYYISGSSAVCQGATTTLTDPTPGGSWSSANPGIAIINPTTGVVTGVSTGTATIDYTLPTGCQTSTSIFVYPTPAPITGVPSSCIGLITVLSDASPAGSWSSSTPSVAPVGPSGVVTGLAAGTATITYTLPTGCYTVYPVSINALPAAITGASSVCAGSSTTFADAVPGGLWSSSNTAIATAVATTGVITGVAAGVATITYTMGASCLVTKTLTVNTLPLPIAGATSLCLGTPVTLTDATTGGTWSSSAPAIATINPATGSVSSVSAGVVVMSYTMGCTATHVLTVNAVPAAITGTLSTCTIGSTTLSNTVPGGTWISGTPAVATVGALSGVVSGVSAGTTTIDYILPGGCFTSAVVSVFALPTVFTVTGGGSYCSGGPGVHIGLSGSQTGINYVLYRGAMIVGTFAGTGSPMDFGLQTAVGTYTVKALQTVSGCSLDMALTADVNVSPSVVPTLHIHAIPGDTVCSGTTVDFHRVATNTGSTPSYRWYVNGVLAGTDTAYSYIPVAGDIVTVKMASSALCAAPDTVSQSDTPTVNPSAVPGVTVAVSPNDTVCRGTIVTITASPIYGGPGPSYQWMKNGIMSGSGAVYSFLPNNGDDVYCVLTSNYPCRTSSTANSEHITMTVDSPVAPSITITAYPGTLLSTADTLILTAVVTGGGTSPSYQWLYNGVAVPGATNDTYIVDSFSTPQVDSITCEVTSSGVCVVTAGEQVYINVAPTGVHSVNGNADIHVVPNPSKGDFVVDGTVTNITDNQMTLTLTNMPGQVVYSKTIAVQGGKIRERISTENLPGGIYVLTLQGADSTTTLKLVIE